jgi:DNA-binding NtrC family response regulator
MDLYDKLREMNLLVVDDDEWIRNSLKLFFLSEGCNTIALETAEEGLHYTDRNHFDIIFVDYRLPGMNGFEFIKHLPDSQTDSFKILFTAYGNKEMATKAKILGFDEFIAKPFTMKTIENSLERLIGCSI